MKSAIFSVAALAAVSSAAPAKRQYPSGGMSGPSDVDILNYALTLEHLEDTFYREGLAKYSVDDFTKAGFTNDTYAKFQTIAADEKTHVAFLQGALSSVGAKAVAECKYTFPYTDVQSFVATASVLEGVGVTAYLGAAAKIMSKDYLTAAGSILTIEARHSAFIRGALKEEPAPQTFDVPLSLNEVFTLAAPMITSCPSDNPTLPVKAFPEINATSTDKTINVGSPVLLAIAGHMTLPSPIYAAFITSTGPLFTNVTQVSGGYQVNIPKGVAGQSYLVLTSCKNSATDDDILAGPAIVEIAGTTASQK